MDDELRLQMQQLFFCRGRWLVAGLLTIVYLIALITEYPNPTLETYDAGYLMFGHLLILLGAKQILKKSNQYVLMSMQIVVSVGMAFLMNNVNASLCYLIGVVIVFVIEDISLSLHQPYYFFSKLVWGYAITIILAGLLVGIIIGPLINSFYILEAISAIMFLSYYIYKAVYDSKYQALQLSQLNVELNAAYKQVSKFTVVEERQRMARDLHDTLTQDLVGIGMELAITESYIDSEQYEKAKNRLKQIQKLTSSSIKESRSMIETYRGITSENAKVSLRSHVIEQTALLEVKYGLKTIVDINDDLMLTGDLLIDVIRMINEALMNVIKHANILNAQVGAILISGQLIIDIENNGDLFPNGGRTRKDHYGLVGMRERAQSHGGDIKILSTSEEGTVVRIKVEMGDTE
ncbi:sensor histidine kinase [Dellaglioa sp. BT-FLS60]